MLFAALMWIADKLPTLMSVAILCVALYFAFIKRAMLAVDAWLPGTGLTASMIMQVHDELVFEVAEEDVGALVEGVEKLMMEAADLSVPLLVEAGVGANWDEAH